MNVHYFQHVPFEGLGSIGPWLKSKSARISVTQFYADTYFPNVRDIDWLIIMGGPMSVNDEQTYPWLQAEKKFIADAIATGKIVLGICLGAQLIASSFRAKVYQNRNREIGWFPIEQVEQRENTNLKYIFPSHLEVFHWHGETFDLPTHAVHLVRSEGCDNQAFSIGDRVLGLQFHLEATPNTVKSLIEQCQNDLAPDYYVQSAAEMLSVPSRFLDINSVMDALLEHLYNIEPTHSMM
jgi:GMP synthase-like glutamine amidotransferase